MTRNEFETVINPFLDKCEKDTDPYYVIHFSREDDKYTGFDDGLDFGDALIIVSGLCEKFGIDPACITPREIMNKVDQGLPNFEQTLLKALSECKISLNNKN